MDKCFWNIWRKKNKSIWCFAFAFCYFFRDSFHRDRLDDGWKWCRTCGRTSDSTTRHWKLAFCWHLTEMKLISAHVPRCRLAAETLAHTYINATDSVTHSRIPRHVVDVWMLLFLGHFYCIRWTSWNSVYTKQTRDIYYYFLLVNRAKSRCPVSIQFNVEFSVRSKCQRKFKKICSIRVAMCIENLCICAPKSAGENRDDEWRNTSEK